VRAFVVVVSALLVGCQTPPGVGGVTDATPEVPDAPPPPPPDAAAAADAPPSPDAPPPDAPPTPDAAPPDAGRPDGPPPVDAAPPPDGGSVLDPYGITLLDVSFGAVGVWMHGGRSDDDLWGVGSGAAIGDVDGDDDRDVVLARIDDSASGYSGGPSTILRNVGSGMSAFSVDTTMSAANAGTRGHAAALGDMDRDGDLDLFIGMEGPDKLFENDGAGFFTDVTAAAGVAGLDVDVTMGAVWADLNQDGLLDLYVLQHTHSSPPLPAPDAADRLFLNLGDGTFEDVTALAGTIADGSGQAVAVFDFQGTGIPVIYVANDRFAVDGFSVFGDEDLLPGDDWFELTSISDSGVPHYTQRNDVRGVLAQRSSMGIAIADVDGDLTPDVYVTDWGRNDLYLNPTPGGPLVETLVYNFGMRLDPLGTMLISWSARFLDLDRDGLNEIFVVNGSIGVPVTCTMYAQLDHYMRQGTPGAAYDWVTGQVGLPWPPTCTPSLAPAAGRGAAWGDLDGDGDHDMVLTPSVEPYRLYRNDTPAVNHAVRLRLAGTVSAPNAAGARMIVTRLDGSPHAAFLYAGGDTLSQSDLPLEVGIGGDTAVLSAYVHWPSGFVQRVDGLPGFAVDTDVVVIEPNWLDLWPRSVDPGDPAPVLTYTVMDETGTPVGAAGAGHVVEVVRSDGVAVVVNDMGDGTYTAVLPHPGVVRRTVLTVSVDGVVQRPRYMLNFH
jgi:hypothetical protein